MKAISQKSRNLSPKITSTVEKELKLFYFKAFKRRSKNLLTLELIKECYADQIKFFINDNIYISTLTSIIASRSSLIVVLADAGFG